jgi:hypothetical protein
MVNYHPKTLPVPAFAVLPAADLEPPHDREKVALPVPLQILRDTPERHEVEPQRRIVLLSGCVDREARCREHLPG